MLIGQSHRPKTKSSFTCHRPRYRVGGGVRQTSFAAFGLPRSHWQPQPVVDEFVFRRRDRNTETVLGPPAPAVWFPDRVTP